MPFNVNLMWFIPVAPVGLVLTPTNASAGKLKSLVILSAIPRRLCSSFRLAQTFVVLEGTKYACACAFVPIPAARTYIPISTMKFLIDTHTQAIFPVPLQGVQVTSVTAVEVIAVLVIIKTANTAYINLLTAFIAFFLSPFKYERGNQQNYYSRR